MGLSQLAYEQVRLHAMGKISLSQEPLSCGRKSCHNVSTILSRFMQQSFLHCKGFFRNPLQCKHDNVNKYINKYIKHVFFADTDRMVLKQAETQVRSMLADTILALCRNTLPYQAQVSIEGLLGITIDHKEIFLVNVNETIKKEKTSRFPGSTKEKHNSTCSRSQNSNVSFDTQDQDSMDSTRMKLKHKKQRRRSRGNSGSNVGDVAKEVSIDGDQPVTLSTDMIKQEQSVAHESKLPGFTSFTEDTSVAFGPYSDTRRNSFQISNEIVHNQNHGENKDYQNSCNRTSQDGATVITKQEPMESYEASCEVKCNEHEQSVKDVQYGGFGPFSVLSVKPKASSPHSLPKMASSAAMAQLEQLTYCMTADAIQAINCKRTIHQFLQYLFAF